MIHHRLIGFCLILFICLSHSDIVSSLPLNTDNTLYKSLTFDLY